jgi:phosphoglycolate phosphatase
VLWDVDYTLIAAPGGAELYGLALAELYGLQLPTGLQSMAGRTDSAIAVEVLSLAGVPDPEAEVPRFQAVLARLAPQAHGIVRERGRVLPGAAEAIAALADHAATPPGARLATGARAATGAAPGTGARAATESAPGTAADGQVIQSLLTGNIPAMAQVKLTALGLTAHLDLDIGAYGDVSRIRADLVPVARQNATARYGGDFTGRATVLVGDTPSDIEAAAAHGARSVGVASGQFTGQQLIEAGADAVLADLTDTAMVVSAIVTGRP